MDLADDVAAWMNANAVGIGYPNSTLRTYVVAIGDPKNTYGEMTALQQIAARGGGDYVVADDFATLESNIQDVFMAIVNRSTSFSAASITTVQSSGYTSAFLPRFTPNGGQLWPGTVSRFSLFNEFSAGCTSLDQGKVTSANPNGDADCNDFYLTDSNKAFVGESNGQFVVLDNGKTWDGGWPAKSGGDGGVAASPFWEAGQVLAARVNGWLAGNSAQQRKIYTVAPDSSGGYDPTLIQFTSANAGTLTPLFQLGGVNGDFCTTLGNLTRHVYASETDCGQDLIDFVNGKDILFQNPVQPDQPAAEQLPGPAERARGHLPLHPGAGDPAGADVPLRPRRGEPVRAVAVRPALRARRAGRVRELLLHQPVPDPVPPGRLERRHAARLQHRQRHGDQRRPRLRPGHRRRDVGLHSRRTSCPSSSGWRSGTGTS